MGSPCNAHWAAGSHAKRTHPPNTHGLRSLIFLALPQTQNQARGRAGTRNVPACLTAYKCAGQQMAPTCDIRRLHGWRWVWKIGSECDVDCLPALSMASFIPSSASPDTGGGGRSWKEAGEGSRQVEGRVVCPARQHPLEGSCMAAALVGHSRLLEVVVCSPRARRRTVCTVVARPPQRSTLTKLSC